MTEKRFDRNFNIPQLRSDLEFVTERRQQLVEKIVSVDCPVDGNLKSVLDRYLTLLRVEKSLRRTLERSFMLEEKK